MLTADLIINFIGVSCILLYIWFLIRQWSFTRLELSLVLFLSVIGLLLICRGISWIYDSRLMITSVYFFVSVFPLTYLIYCESLLKRHSPLRLKLITVVAPTIIFVCLSISKTVNYESLAVIVFMLFLLFHQVVLNVFLLASDRKGLTISENAMADSLPVIVCVMILFVLSDFMPVSTFLHQQVGAIGVLIFIYSLVRFQGRQESKWSIGKEVCGIMCLTAVAAFLCYSVLPVRDQYLYVRITSVTLAIILFLTIASRLIFLSSGSKDLICMKWLAEIPVESTEQLLSAIRFSWAEADFIIAKRDELDGYDCEKISIFLFQNNGRPGKIMELRKILRRHWNLPRTGSDFFTQVQMDGAEELMDILERNGMTHAYALNFYPFELLLMRAPQIGSGEMLEREITLILKVYARILGRRQEARDAENLSTAST